MHALCTIATYGFWWWKLLDVQQPIAVVKDQSLRSLLRVLYATPRKDGLLMTALLAILGNETPAPTRVHVRDQDNIKNVYFYQDSNRPRIRLPPALRTFYTYFTLSTKERFERMLIDGTGIVVRHGESFIIGGDLELSIKYNHKF